MTTVRYLHSDDFRKRLREVLDDVEHHDQMYEIRRYKTPSAVMVPVEWFERAQLALGMADADTVGDSGSSKTSSRLVERIGAVEAFGQVGARLVIVGDLAWPAVEADFRLLAINSSLRRQIETIRAAVHLARQGLGHLAVSFVRASLEDVTYLAFFVGLELSDSQELFKLLGKWDSLRSLLAQRDYVGDEVMAQLWYSKAFLDAAADSRDEVRTALKLLQRRYRWSGGVVPSADWIADQAGKRDLYDYLHAATSRALHFSAGEIMRRGWGHPSGRIVTDKEEFREHLASFALDQLWRLHVETWRSARPLLEEAGISSDDDLGFDELKPILDRLSALGKVPLVHAHEWNLSPEGPLDPRLKPFFADNS